VRRLRIDPERSTIVVEARSNAGPIAWEGVGPTGELAFAPDGAAIGQDPPPYGWLELRLEALSSGNRMYDAELLRRVEARRHPVARIELERIDAGDAEGLHRARGRLEFHGVTQPLTGDLEIRQREDGTMRVVGARQVDIRDFGLPAPTMLMLKVYPDVRVHLVVEAVPVDVEPTSPREW
jgi:hypothetical protein